MNRPSHKENEVITRGLLLIEKFGRAAAVIGIVVAGLTSGDCAFADVDTDGDGLSDSDEINIYFTDPNNPDTDGDGLSDGDEIMTTITDPNNPDSDGDGLTDGQEVLTYFTDPLYSDTDGDMVSDGYEVATGTDPLDPSSYYIRIMAVQGQSQGRRVTFWPATTHNTYTLQWAASFSSGNWTNVPSQTSVSGATNGMMTLTDTNAETGFYRVKVQ